MYTMIVLEEEQIIYVSRMRLDYSDIDILSESIDFWDEEIPTPNSEYVIATIIEEE